MPFGDSWTSSSEVGDAAISVACAAAAITTKFMGEEAMIDSGMMERDILNYWRYGRI